MKSIRSLFSRSKKSEKSLLGILDAVVDMEFYLDLRPSSNAGILVKPLKTHYYRESENIIREMLQLIEDSYKTRSQIEKDSYGYTWILMEDEDFEDLVNAVYMLESVFEDHNLKNQILVGVFRFEGDYRLYWIYSFKKGKFYPFIPEEPSEKKRNTAQELRVANLMEKILPVEKKVEEWFPLWDIPF
jgi:hypothetical protein